jgi:tetratricopeptide (TPR) repeat protein
MGTRGQTGAAVPARGPGATKLRAKPAAVKAKPTAAGPTPDPLVQRYEQGLRAMYSGKWTAAARAFREVSAARDEPELAGRARQQLLACELRRGDGADAAHTADDRQTDPFLLAVFEKNRGGYDAALKICARGGRQSRDERFAYLVASIHALRGAREEAVRFLGDAIELNPKNRVHAFHDPDFAALREGGDLADLLRP